MIPQEDVLEIGGAAVCRVDVGFPPLDCNVYAKQDVSDLSAERSDFQGGAIVMYRTVPGKDVDGASIFDIRAVR